MIYAYPCQLTPDEEDGGLVATFPDVPEAITGGRDRAEALAMAEEALATALAGYVHEKRDIPTPSEAADGLVSVPVPTVVAAKLALYSAMRTQRITKVELADRLGVSESAVRKLTNPDHRSHMSQVHKALRAVEHGLTSEVKPTVSSYFERFIGELFDRLGCRTRKHPQIGNRHADLLATTPVGEEFYVEATVVDPEQLSTIRSTESDVCNKLNSMCRTGFFYWFIAQANGELYRNLAREELRQIKEWVEGLSTTELRDVSETFTYPSGPPPKNVDRPSRNWTLEIHAMPRSKHMWGVPAPVLAGVGRAGGLDSVSPLVRAARSRVKQHKGVPGPLLLAMNDMADSPSDRIDISMALFGWEQAAETGVSRITPPKGYKRTRSIWGTGENKTISAILLFRGLLPHTIPYVEVCLYENPSARHPIPTWLRESFPYAVVEETEGAKFLRWPSEQRLSWVLGIPPETRPYAALEQKMNAETEGIFRRPVA